ncbi:hypothetical protein C3Y87_05580 [Carbonactinospora thermoautotrophica]|uniref:Uncharacterized protein n=1 Tax=Carbonactinospora thermoautotrophica TaxID=1469144 RepID=A0A132MQW6_9ACTN|nr:hypothetical protein [Carbonactinospora thermoautotrophica]KWX00231.1 hypothetical protein TH66_15310 [Carbonactinospora thermoautotrophica]KWX01734.1 hypothetical protein LI90_2766 [Carbonactinospora thermoautotrophica]MCX9190891.1 hypothetical protein [Carbonactinospora thermoautotrophica]
MGRHAQHRGTLLGFVVHALLALAILGLLPLTLYLAGMIGQDRDTGLRPLPSATCLDGPCADPAPTAGPAARASAIRVTVGW